MQSVCPPVLVLLCVLRGSCITFTVVQHCVVKTHHGDDSIPKSLEAGCALFYFCPCPKPFDCRCSLKGQLCVKFEATEQHIIALAVHP